MRYHQLGIELAADRKKKVWSSSPAGIEIPLVVVICCHQWFVCTSGQFTSRGLFLLYTSYVSNLPRSAAMVHWPPKTLSNKSMVKEMVVCHYSSVIHINQTTYQGGGNLFCCFVLRCVLASMEVYRMDRYIYLCVRDWFMWYALQIDREKDSEKKKPFDSAGRLAGWLVELMIHQPHRG